MKKLLLGSLALTLFSIAIIVFQISCQKIAEAQINSVNLELQDKSLISKPIQTQVGSSRDSAGRTVSVMRTTNELYTVKNDGTNLQKINISLPAGLYILPGNSTAIISPDGKKLIFLVGDLSMQQSVYSCSIDGSNLKKMADGVWNLHGTY